MPDWLAYLCFVTFVPIGTLIAIGAAELYRRYANWRTFRKNFR